MPVRLYHSSVSRQLRRSCAVSDAEEIFAGLPAGRVLGDGVPTAGGKGVTGDCNGGPDGGSGSGSSSGCGSSSCCGAGHSDCSPATSSPTASMGFRTGQGGDYPAVAPLLLTAGVQVGGV